MKIKTYAEVEIPRVPNFLRYGSGDGQVFDVADMSDRQLKEIGAAWTKLLIEVATKRRQKSKSK